MMEFLILFIFISVLVALFFTTKSKNTFKKQSVDKDVKITALNSELYKLKDYISKASKNNKKLLRISSKLKKDLLKTEKHGSR